MPPNGEYPIIVASGSLHGSVRISGTIPDTLSAWDAQRLEEAIRTVRTAGVNGLRTTVHFTVTEENRNV